MIVFEFNSHSSGSGVPAAIQIARQHKGKIDNNMFRVLNRVGTKSL